MAQVTAAPLGQHEFGQTSRRDAWWLGPLLTFLGLLAFLIYAYLIVLAVPGYFEIRRDKPGSFATGHENVFFQENPNPAVAPYLAPFSSPLLYDEQSHHSWIKENVPR